MGRSLRAVAGLLTALAVMVTPAMLSACVALCVPDMAGHTMADRATAVPSAHHAMPPAEPSAPPCTEHVASAVAPVSASRVGDVSVPCCADRLASPDAFLTAARSDAHSVVAAPVAARVSWAPAVLASSPAPSRRLSAPPPSPPHRPSVLRI